MKFLISASILFLAINANARSIKLERVCGNLTTVMCVTAPCPFIPMIQTQDGIVRIDKASSPTDAYKNLMKYPVGTDLCVSGLYKDAKKTSISVFQVEPNPPTNTSKFRCVQQINCMPPVSDDTAVLCSEEYAQWADKNCGGRPSRLD